MADRSDVKLAAIFRRGGQKEELLGDGPSSDKQELNQQLQQLAVAWAIPKARWAQLNSSTFEEVIWIQMQPNVSLQLQHFRLCLSCRRGLAAAVWRPLLGAFEVTARGRQQFNGQGEPSLLFLCLSEMYMCVSSTCCALISSSKGMLVAPVQVHMLKVRTADRQKQLTARAVFCCRLHVQQKAILEY
jgi:hypothetical protein